MPLDAIRSGLRISVGRTVSWVRNGKSRRLSAFRFAADTRISCRVQRDLLLGQSGGASDCFNLRSLPSRKERYMTTGLVARTAGPAGDGPAVICVPQGSRSARHSHLSSQRQVSSGVRASGARPAARRPDVVAGFARSSARWPLTCPVPSRDPETKNCVLLQLSRRCRAGLTSRHRAPRLGHDTTHSQR